LPACLPACILELEYLEISFPEISLVLLILVVLEMKKNIILVEYFLMIELNWI
jgi:hypothetical protein